MIRQLLRGTFCALLLASVSFAEEAPAPRISHTYPPPEDVRSPDRTLTHLDGGPVRILIYSPDGRTLAVAGGDKMLRIFDARTGEQGTGELQRTIEGFNDRVEAFAFSNDGKLLTSIQKNRLLRTVDLTNAASAKIAVAENSAGTTLIEPINADSSADFSIVFRAGGHPILVQGDRFQEIEANRAASPISLNLKDATISAAALLPDGKQLAIGTGRGALLLVNLDGGGVKTLAEVHSLIKSIAATATRVVAGASDGTVTNVDLQSKLPDAVRTIKAHDGAVNTVDIRGDQFATGGNDKLAKVWDAATGQLLCIQQSHQAPITSLVINPSHGQKMATGDAQGVVKYWTMPLAPIPPDDLEKIKAALPEKATATPKRPRKLLVFWRADAILHKSGVPAANKAIELMGEKTEAYSADFTRDYEALDPKVLADYDGLVLNSTAHLAIPDAAKQALLDYAKSGHGIVGIHAAIDTFKDWPEGAAIIGATFGGHPWTPSGTWAVKLDEPDHPLLRAFGGKNFKMHDEIYELAAPYSRSDRRVLMSLDLSDPATAGVSPLHRADKDFAVSWIKRYGEGRVFFAMFGHIGQPFQNPAVLQYYLDGIQYALGDLVVDDSPKARTSNQ